MRKLSTASLVLYDVTTLYFEKVWGMVSASLGFRRNAGWTRRSPWGVH